MLIPSNTLINNKLSRFQPENRLTGIEIDERKVNKKGKRVERYRLSITSFALKCYLFLLPAYADGRQLNSALKHLTKYFWLLKPTLYAI